MEPPSLTIAFTVWASVVGMIGAGIIWELMGLRRDVREVKNSLAAQAVEMQGRMTAVETHLHVRDGFVATNHFGLRT